MIGAVLIIVGAIFLLKQLGFIVGDVWGYVWPIALIVIGLLLVFRKRNF